MVLPGWADQRLSEDLPRFRATGEGQTLEFKEAIPTQAHDLAKDVAAFATSGEGTILIGVADDGSLARLDASTAEDRDRLALRVQGIVRTVRPMVTAKIAFATEAGETVLCVEVPEQDEPVYYHEGRPIVRDGRLSRPAEPDEVKELVWKSPSSQFKRHEEELRPKAHERQLENRRQWDELSVDSSRRHSELMGEMRRRMIR